jgi:predicted RNase H-like nuclease (RuvC/YqgF family)
MSFLFGGRTQKLKTMNRILTDAARERSKRIEELERRIEELERQIAQLQQELEPARRAIGRARELEVVAAERAHLVNERDQELAIVREALTKCSLQVENLERSLAQALAASAMPKPSNLLR